MQFRYILTEQNIFFLGLYDVTYELYQKCKDIAEQTINNDNVFNSIKYKKELNQYVKKYGHIFCETAHLYFNDKDLSSIVFSMFTPRKKDNPMKIYWEIVSFPSFLKELETLICVKMRKIYHKMKIADYSERAQIDLNENIKKAISAYNSKDFLPEQKKISYCLAKDSSTILVYTNFFNLTCNRNQHNVEPKVILTQCLETSETISLPINYCIDCNKYYIGKNSLALARKNFGIFLIRTMEYENENNFDDCFSKFNKESELHSYGYNVIVGELSTQQRRDLLCYLLDNGIMSKFEIRRDLEKAINIFKNRIRYTNAKRMWLDDLAFVDEYVANAPYVANLEGE